MIVRCKANDEVIAGRLKCNEYRYKMRIRENLDCIKYVHFEPIIFCSSLVRV